MPSSANQEFWCVCRKYCKGRRRQLYTANTWRRHLREASEDEKDAIRLAGRSDEFRDFLNAASNSTGLTGIKGPADDDHSAHSDPPSGQRRRLFYIACYETSSAKKSWQPPANKTGRALCAHRWLKQVKPNGSKDEFDTYYQTLTAEVKAQYKDEAMKLVADGTWSKGTVEIITEIATLPMY